MMQKDSTSGLRLAENAHVIGKQNTYERINPPVAKPILFIPYKEMEI
jgi:hypothetical protein